MNPFSFTYAPQLPELLLKLNCSIALTTYQAGKLVLISPRDENNLVSLPRTFPKAMGLALKDDKMAIACKDEVVVLKGSQKLAEHYPKNPNTYDILFQPTATFHTGQVDLHDIAFGKDGLWAVNTSFSCLCKIDGNHSFTPVWKPSFITELVSEDRCHLNGLVVIDGHPRYVTVLGTGNSARSWRENITKGGVLIDLKTDQVIIDGLAMPHSPKWYNNELYLLLSATGQFVKADLKNKSIKVIKELNGFCRGLDIIGDYAFIGLSKLRKNSSTFAQLDFAEKADKAGIVVVHLPTQAIVADLTYTASVDEIYEVKILPNTLRPNVLNTINDIYKYALTLPNTTFWAKPESTPQETSALQI